MSRHSLSSWAAGLPHHCKHWDAEGTERWLTVLKGQEQRKLMENSVERGPEGKYITTVSEYFGFDLNILISILTPWPQVGCLHVL